MSSPMSETFAAVDLGSNSFHMVVAKLEDGQVRIIDRIRDMVRIASGLDDTNNLTEEAIERALESLRTTRAAHQGNPKDQRESGGDQYLAPGA